MLFVSEVVSLHSVEEETSKPKLQQPWEEARSRGVDGANFNLGKITNIRFSATGHSRRPQGKGHSHRPQPQPTATGFFETLARFRIAFRGAQQMQNRHIHMWWCPPYPLRLKSFFVQRPCSEISALVHLRLPRSCV